MIKTKQDLKEAINRIDNNDIDTSLKSDLFYDIGFVFDNGLSEDDNYFIDVDYSKAYYWYNRASEFGHLDASLRLADFLSEGHGCEKNIKRSITLYEYCIDKGSSSAANNLGVVYRDLHKYEEAFKFYKIAEQLMTMEYNKAVFTLNTALCYLYGIGVSKNIDIAIEQLSELVNDEDNNYTCIFEIQEAAYILGTIYLSQKNKTEEARNYLLVANEDNDHNSAQELLNIIGRD